MLYKVQSWRNWERGGEGRGGGGGGGGGEGGGGVHEEMGGDEGGVAVIIGTVVIKQMIPRVWKLEIEEILLN